MKALKRYGFTLLGGLLAVFGIIWAKGIFNQTAPDVIFHILCDAFFIVAVLLLATGLLIFSTNEGTFDILAYGMSSFLGIFRNKRVPKYETFYDYRESRQDKKVKFGYFLICGAGFLAVAFLMYFLYRQNI